LDSVPDHVLEPRHTWEDQTAFDLKAQELADNFKENFQKFGAVSDQIKAAGPR